MEHTPTNAPSFITGLLRSFDRAASTEYSDLKWRKPKSYSGYHGLYPSEFDQLPMDTSEIDSRFLMRLGSPPRARKITRMRPNVYHESQIAIRLEWLIIQGFNSIET